MRERLDDFQPKRFPEIVMLKSALKNIESLVSRMSIATLGSFADIVVVGSCVVVSCIETGDTYD